MTAPWIWAFIALCLVVALLGLFMLGLFARIDHLVDPTTRPLAAEQGAPRRMGGPAVGDIAPTVEFNGDGLNEPLHFSNAVLVFASAGCAPCEWLISDLQRKPLPADGRTQMLFWDGESNPPSVAGWRIVAAHVGHLRRLFQVESTPFALVLDADRTVLASGVPNSTADMQRLLNSATKRNGHRRAATGAAADS